MVATGLVVLGVAVRWVAVGVDGPAWELASAWVLGTAVVAGLLSVAAPLPGDDRVLRAARARTGRVLWGVGWRFGSLRQELALWTGLGAGVLGLVVAATGSSDGAPAGLVTARRGRSPSSRRRRSSRPCALDGSRRSGTCGVSASATGCWRSPG